MPNLQQMLEQRIAGQLADPTGTDAFQSIVDRLGQQRQQGAQQALRGMGQRGLMDSTMTGGALRNIEDAYSQSLTDAATQQQQQASQGAMNFLQGIQLPQQQMQDARRSNLWRGIGGLAGSFLGPIGGAAGGALGNWLDNRLG